MFINIVFQAFKGSFRRFYFLPLCNVSMLWEEMNTQVRQRYSISIYIYKCRTTTRPSSRLPFMSPPQYRFTGYITHSPLYLIIESVVFDRISYTLRALLSCWNSNRMVGMIV